MENLLIKVICKGDLKPNHLRKFYTIESVLKLYEEENKNANV